MKDTVFCSNLRLNIKGNLREFSQPLVMGIINLTPDSFYAGSRLAESDSLLSKVRQMINEGADIIDVGGYSSRPGAKDISVETEIDRIFQPVQAIKASFPDLLVSIDTFRSEVALKAIEAGADMINDISGGKLDSNIFDIAASNHVPYVLMHMRGTPQNMKELNSYSDLVSEVAAELKTQVDLARSAGIEDIILDPGFGFSKNIDQNYQLLKNMDALHTLNLPLLVGISRKSMIYKTLDLAPEDSLNGTTALNTIALLQGACILRVHDVKEARECITLVSKMINQPE